MNITLMIALLTIFVFYYIVSTYNWLQTALTRITASIQDIGNQLKRQASLIPNLQTSVKTYLKHEKDIFEEITSARKLVEKAENSNDINKVGAAADALNTLVPKLQVLMESNPEIKGERVISKLMDELRDTADKLMYARRVVIDLTADYNQKLLVFPSNFVAKSFGFLPQTGLKTADKGYHLEVSDEEMKEVKL